MTGKLHNARNSTVIKNSTKSSKIHMHVQSKESSVSWTSRVKPKLTVYDKLSKYFAFFVDEVY